MPGQRDKTQPLVMTGDPDKLVGNAVGYRCRVCRRVFCGACAWAHFGLGVADRVYSEWPRCEMEAGVAAGAFDDLVKERAAVLAERSS